MKRLGAADLPSPDVAVDAEPLALALSLDELALARAEALRTTERRIARVAPRADRGRGLRGLEANAARVDPARTAALAAQSRLLLRAT